MYSPKPNRLKKVSIWLVIFFFIFQLFNPNLFSSNEAKAIIADTEFGEISIITSDSTRQAADTAKETGEEVKETILDRVFKGLILSASITLRNTMVYMSQQMAEQTVNWMATGDWGQGAMFYEQAWDKFTDDLQNQTVGVFLDNLSQTVWEETGFDICEPALPSVKIEMMIGLELPNLEDPGMIEQETPDCTLSKFTNNWEAFGDHIKDKYSSLKTEYGNFMDEPGAMSLAYLQEAGSQAFEPRYSDIGTFLTLQDELQAEQEEVVKDEEKQREEGEGQKAKLSASGENVESPAYAGKKQIEKEIEDVKDMPKSEMESSKEVITEIPESMAAAFLNSFVSSAFSELIMKKLFDQGISNTAESYKPRQYVFEEGEQLEREIKQASTVSKVSYNVNSKQIDLLTAFTNCTGDRQLNNCVIDNNFAQAVRAADQGTPMSLREAIDSGRVRGDLPLISQADSRNNSDNCYEIGWCYSNLVKLRKARIVPIGWELAAQKSVKGVEVTLEEAMNNFDVDTSDFYRLVDPEWILQYPTARCEASVYGENLLSSNTSTRAEVCADVQSCLREDESGNCEAWGYCAAEKSSYRFGGQECDGQYSSCRVLTDSEGNEVKYLLDTVDDAGCDPNNIGCKWYSLVMDNAGDAWEWQDDDNNKIFLNKKIQDYECSPGSEGCTRFVNTAAGLGTNLIPNGDFEIYEGLINDAADNSNVVLGWYDNDSFAASNLDIVESGSRATALDLNSESVFSQRLHIVPKAYKRYFAVSMMATPTSSSANIDLNIVPVSGEQAGLTIEKLANGADLLDGVNLHSWKKIYQIFETETVGEASTSGLGGNYLLEITANGNINIDDVMVEEIEQPSFGDIHQFTEYATKNVEYVKKAPDYFACYNITADADANTIANYGMPLINDQIEYADDAVSSSTVKGCTGFASLCTAQEVGCEQYTASGSGRVVNGVVSFADYCPQQCDGYSTFSQSKTYFGEDLFPVYFLPDTAETCSADQVGCEEFTNLDELTQGGEAKEYFSELRLCEQLPENAGNCENFYTWVAEEEAGYQLKTYHLKDADHDGVPDTIGQPNTLACNKFIFDSQLNPDCREFYDEAGRASYRLYSQTITCSTDCHPYRRTLQYEDSDLLTAQQQCERRQGVWSGGECVFYAIPNEGKTCSAEAAGCKEYKGNYSGNEQIVFQSSFSSEDAEAFNDGPFIVTIAEGSVISGTSVELATDQTFFTEGEYLLSFWARKQNVGANLTLTVDLAGDLAGAISGDQLNEWALYTYSFNVPSADYSTEVSITGTAGFFMDNMTIKRVADVNYLIKDSWTTPVVCDQDLLTDEDLPQAQVGCREYTDREGTIHYLKTFSGLCSADKVGCQALVDTKNNLYPFEKEYKEVVSNEYLCGGPPMITDALSTIVELYSPTLDGDQCIFEFEDIGGNIQDLPIDLSLLCNDGLNGVGFGNIFYDFDAEGQIYEWDADEERCYVTKSVEESDSVIYLVNDDDNQCANTEKGCKAVGLPSFTVDDDGDIVVDTWDTYFYRLDPELFDVINSPLCSGTASSCNEYTDETGATYLFKDPQGKICEWKQGTVSNVTVMGWFEKGTNNPCGIEGNYKDYYGDGVKHMIKSDDIGYTGWVGECPESEDQCTAFIDPMDDLNNDGIGQTYYYIDNEQIDRTCTGVNLKAGCVLFENTSNSQLTYDSAATYDTAYGNNLVTAVNADTEEDADSNDLIKVVRERECAAWYDCRSSSWNWDPNQNKYVEVCSGIGLCDRLSTDSGSDRCGHFVKTTDTVEEYQLNILTQNRPLQMDDAYSSRSIEWNSYDYSGYSIPNYAPLHYYDAFDINSVVQNKTCGGYIHGTSCETDNVCSEGLSCEVVSDYRLVNKSNVECDAVADCVGLAGCDITNPETCQCLNGYCVRPNGVSFSGSPDPGCRAYPTEDAPFPYSVKNLQAFDNVNVSYVDDTHVSDVGGMDFGCYYKSVEYGGGALTKYIPSSTIYSPASPDGFCQDDPETPCGCNVTEFDDTGAAAPKDKNTCFSTNCGDGSEGICLRKNTTQEIIEYRGWQGYCLEADKSLPKNGSTSQHPCLTWYPVGALAGLQDVQNQYDVAGYNPAPDTGRLFCTDTKGMNVSLGGAEVGLLSEDQSYVIHGESYGIGYCKGDDPDFDFCYWDKTGDSSHNSYIESYLSRNRDIYLDDIAGIVIEMGNANAKDYPRNGNGRAIAWYEKSYVGTEGEKQPPVAIIKNDGSYLDGFYMMADDANSGVMTQGTLSNYTFYADDATELESASAVENEHGEDYLNWNYWEVMWPGGASYANGEGRYSESQFHDGGIEKIPEYNERGAWKFMGTFWDHNKGGCRNVLTGQYWEDGGPCAADNEEPNPDFETFKDSSGEWQFEDCDSPPAGVYQYDGDPIFNEDVEGKCGNRNTWINTQCKISENENPDDVEEDENLNPKCDNGITKCFDDGDGDDYGYCDVDPLTEEVGNLSWHIVNHCAKGDYSSGVNNYFGARLLFDEDGRYRGQWHSICDASGGSGYVSYRIYFILREKCTQMIQVQAGDENRARTQDIYEKRIGESAILSTSSTSTEGIFYDTTFSPMGSAFGEEPNGDSAMYVPDKWADESDELAPGGSPYSFGYTVSEDQENMAGTPYNCSGGSCATQHFNLSGNQSSEAGIDVLKNYFAKIYEKWTWNNKEKEYIEDDDFNWSSRPDEQSPIIAAAVSSGTLDSDGNPVYLAYPYRVAINDFIEGPIEAKDGQYVASIRFYAWADDNQMPIRNVKVDAGIQTIGAEGKYKNHKPRCQHSANEPLGWCEFSTYGMLGGYACDDDNDCSHLPYPEGTDPGECESSYDRFGDVTEYDGTSACQEGYFEREVIYDCDPAGLPECTDYTDKNTDTPIGETQQACRIDDFEGGGKDVCRYAVSVQVKDNWGICNTDSNWISSTALFRSVEGTENCSFSKEKGEYYDGYIYVYEE